MTRLRIPDPALVVLIGAAGSGKSTFATRHFATDEILSSDAYRAAISGDPADQTVNRAAFRALHADLSRRLSHRRLTVVDATNLTAGARSVLRERAGEAGIATVAVVLDLPEAVVLARNASRLVRVVPEDVVRRHLRDVRRIVAEDVLTAERFGSIVRFSDLAELDRVEVRRDPWVGPASGPR